MLSSTSKELLKVSLNKYWGPNPNKEGNLCIVGHNYNDERFFGKLHKIENGDEIELTDMTGKTKVYYICIRYIYSRPRQYKMYKQKNKRRNRDYINNMYKKF